MASSTTTTTTGEQEEEIVDILIIGAGVAGLYAAHLLHSSLTTKQQQQATAPPLKLVVLEGSGRYGGRVLTQNNFAPWPVDLGGEFIHGENTLHYNFCQEHQLPMQQTFCSFPPLAPMLAPEKYFSDGRPIQEYFFLPLQQHQIISWVDAQRDVEHGGVQHLPTMLRVLSSLDSGGVEAPECSGMDLCAWLVERGVHQSMLSLADSILAKTWSADLWNLDPKSLIEEGACFFLFCLWVVCVCELSG